jgi:hypothetical protein
LVRAEFFVWLGLVVDSALSLEVPASNCRKNPKGSTTLIFRQAIQGMKKQPAA